MDLQKCVPFVQQAVLWMEMAEVAALMPVLCYLQINPALTVVVFELVLAAAAAEIMFGTAVHAQLGVV